MEIGIIGYGKMGRMVEAEALAAGHSIAFISRSPTDSWSKADVLIEFTEPGMMIGNLRKALELKIPMVSGTTGWYDSLPEVKDLVAEHKGSFLYASNFSLGVNLFFEMNRVLARLMSRFEEYDVHIEEIHHTEKKDSPSGTAITTAEGILTEQQRYSQWRLNDGKSLSKNELGITALREPGVPGTHTVTYSSDIDKISLSHEAKNRRGFAQGAMLAAKWLPGNEGLFTMKDILKLN
jgi:4-hydroxy-tetrahydrodipicolinate reductase